MTIKNTDNEYQVYTGVSSILASDRILAGVVRKGCSLRLRLGGAAKRGLLYGDDL